MRLLGLFPSILQATSGLRQPQCVLQRGSCASTDVVTLLLKWWRQAPSRESLALGPGSTLAECMLTAQNSAPLSVTPAACSLGFCLQAGGRRRATRR